MTTNHSGVTAVQRLIAGDEWRKSRLHDMRGHLVGVRDLVTDLPRAFGGAVLRRAAGLYPRLPWIPYPAIREFRKMVQPTWRVLDHGSGMSTIWWAERVASVDAIEDNPVWHAKTKAEIDKLGLTNVRLELRSGEAYYDLSAFPDAYFDFVIIDGSDREKVAAQAPRTLKRPGWIYLDNTDKAAAWHENYGEAEDLLREHATRSGARMSYFTGLAPATVIAQEGLLIAYP